MSNWRATVIKDPEDGTTSTHVVPIADVRQHTLTDDCRCVPVRTSVYSDDPVNPKLCGQIVVHAAWDRREVLEHIAKEMDHG